MRFVVKWLATQKSFFSCLLRARSNYLRRSKTVVPNAIRKISVRSNRRPGAFLCLAEFMKVHRNRSTHFSTLVRNGSKFTIDLVPLNLRKQEACNANSPGRARSAEEDVECTTAWCISSPKKSVAHRSLQLGTQYSALHNVLHKRVRSRACKIQLTHFHQKHRSSVKASNMQIPCYMNRHMVLKKH
jgi:hypothetical protein